MAGCVPCSSDGSSSLDVDRLTSDINHLLGNKRGRDDFKKFLQQNAHTLAVSCLDIYDACEKLLNQKPRKSDYDEILVMLEELDDFDASVLDDVFAFTDTDCADSEHGKHVLTRVMTACGEHKTIASTYKRYYVPHLIKTHRKPCLSKR